MVGEEPLIVRQTSAFDREAFDVNFSLVRDGTQVLTITKKLKVISKTTIIIESNKEYRDVS